MFKIHTRGAEYAELSAMFFLQSMATGMWLVPLSRLLAAHNLDSLRPYAFATSALAAFVSPLIFGAMADRHASPVSVLRWLSAASGISLALATWSIARGWPAWAVLLTIQVYSICATPTGSISSTIVFSRLKNSQREFGPIRAAATFGWMCGCWVISGLHADASPISGYSAAFTWVLLAAFTFFLPSVPPPPLTGPVRFSERMGWDALTLLRNRDHRVVFITTALFSIPIAGFYPYTPPHLAQSGFTHTSAWMSLGQVTELFAMFALGGVMAKWRLKWIMGAGLVFGVTRFCFCALDTRLWLLAGIFLHGITYTLFFVTVQIYLNERVDTAWRARAQALMWLMTGGVGNLVGYLGIGLWFRTVTTETTRWPVFWGGLAAACAAVLLYFLLAYHGRGAGRRNLPPEPADTPAAVT